MKTLYYIEFSGALLYFFYIERKLHPIKIKDKYFPKEPFPPGKLGKLFQSFDEEIELARPIEIAKKAMIAKNTLEESLEALEVWAKPTKGINVNLLEMLQELALNTADHLNMETIENQINLIKWYSKKNHSSSALSLSREVMVNRMLLAMGNTENWIDKDERKKGEDLLNEYQKDLTNKKKGFSEEVKKIINLWNEISNKRNNVAHHGFNKQSSNVNIKQIESVLEKFHLSITSPAWEKLKPV